MDKKTNDDYEIDLVDLFYLLKSRLWVILLFGFIIASITGLVSSFLLTPVYTSQAQLYILSKTTSITSLADIQLGSQLTQDYMVLVKSRPVVTKVNDDLKLNMTYGQLSGIVKVNNPSNTRILVISVDYPDAYLAKRIVDDFVNVSKSQIAKIMDTQEPTIVEEGNVPETPSSPNIKKNVIIGGFIGVFLAAGIIIVLHLMDDTIKNSEDVEKYLGISTLALIPVESSGEKQAEIDKKNRRRHHRVHSRKRKG